MKASTNIHRGMRVRSHDGHNLGRVVQLLPDGFLARHGLLFRRTRRVRFDDVDQIDAGVIRLTHASSELVLSPEDLEALRVETAKYASRRLPDAEPRWDGKATSELERLRMDDAEARRREEVERLEDQERPLPPNEGDHPIA